jgi:hypothetical protein
MAHPDKTRGGSEKGQRQHAGQTSRHSDAGMQDRSQHGGRGGEASTASSAPAETERQADELSRADSDGTPPLKGKTSKVRQRKAGQP